MQDTAKWTGRERAGVSRWLLCQVLERRQEPACFFGAWICAKILRIVKLSGIYKYTHYYNVIFFACAVNQ